MGTHVFLWRVVKSLQYKCTGRGESENVCSRKPMGPSHPSSNGWHM